MQSRLHPRRHVTLLKRRVCDEHGKHGEHGEHGEDNGLGLALILTPLPPKKHRRRRRGDGGEGNGEDFHVHGQHGTVCESCLRAHAILEGHQNPRPFACV